MLEFGKSAGIDLDTEANLLIIYSSRRFPHDYPINTFCGFVIYSQNHFIKKLKKVSCE